MRDMIGHNLQRWFCLAALLLLGVSAALAEEKPAKPPLPEEPFGIGLEGFPYPYPVRMFTLSEDGERLRMAYMDVRPKGEANGQTVLLLHGRNFPSSYWRPTIEALAGNGYRVVAPDQIGFGKSSKPLSDLHFDQLARNTIALLDELKLDKVAIVAHSMGGMLAVRLARAYPERIEKLLLAGPIGLEDYRLYVPPVAAERIVEQEDKVTPDGYRRQLGSVYALTLPPDALDPFVEARMRIRGSADYPRWLQAFANSYEMIWREPAAAEIPLLVQPVLFAIGENDHVAPGRDFAPEELRPQMGQNLRLAQELAGKMKNARVEAFEGIGHLPQLEAEQRFNEMMLRFLDEGQ
jgi:pimeloyl-ACP methyl ester carboxylesterase